VVLLDRQMPDLDGIEVCRWLREEQNNSLLPVLMVTGQSDRESLAQCLTAGADDFIRKPFDLHELLCRARNAAQRKRLTDQLDNMESMLYALARMVEAKDPCTGDHCGRLSAMAKNFGSYLGLSDGDITALQRGGVLHDIGKLGIPDHILLKPGKLSDEEMAVMRTHTLIGYKLCEPLKTTSTALPIIRGHHERWDGTGYPDGLAGEDIPYLARIFQILDIYDALRSERPYKKSFSKEKSLAILWEEEQSGLLDPSLVKQFVDMMESETFCIDDSLELSDTGSQTYTEINAIAPIG
jgi:putative two-component system response regulator